MRRFLPFAALLGVAILLGCQDIGTGPDGLVPQFNKPSSISEIDCIALGKVFENGHCHGGGGGDPVVDPGTLFNSPGFTCGGGATSTGGTSFGTVNFNQPRDDSHMHANVQLRGALQGDYNIFGNHDLVCLLMPTDVTNTWVDFLLRPAHATTVTVGANGKGKARIGLDFGGPDGIGAPASHAAGAHNLWVTLVGTSGDADGVVLRSTAIEVVIPEHEGH